MFDIHGDGLVGVRVNTSSNITLLIISTSAQSISDVNASAERALQTLLKLKVTDPVMVVDQQGFPQTFVPQEYPLGVVTNIVRDLGGILTTKQKGDSVLATMPARTNGAGCVQHPPGRSLLLISSLSAAVRTPSPWAYFRRIAPTSNLYTHPFTRPKQARP